MSLNDGPASAIARFALIQITCDEQLQPEDGCLWRLPGKWVHR